MTAPNRAVTLLGVAGREMNDELAIIAMAISEAIAALEPGHRAWPFLLEAPAAAQRCCWKTSVMLNYASRKGAARTTASLEYLASRGAM